MAQTKAQKVAGQKMRTRDQTARKILQQLAREDGIPFARLLEEIEARGGVREYIEIREAIILREASESPEVEH